MKTAGNMRGITKPLDRRFHVADHTSAGVRHSARRPRVSFPQRRAPLVARYPVNGAWPAEMRIDMLAAYLDFRNVRELVLAVSRGEAPPPTSYRGTGRSREAIWAKVIVDNHIAPGIAVRQNLAKVDLAALA